MLIGKSRDAQPLYPLSIEPIGYQLGTQLCDIPRCAPTDPHRCLQGCTSITPSS
jgi:hypothetical protein